ncbi:MAG: hypothetical protein QM831_07510 [Kofleriaceae bacterium]
MPTIDKLTIKLRGVSKSDARRLASQLGPALQRAIGTSPLQSAKQLDVKVPNGRGALADRIATPLAKAMRGGSR